MPSIHKKTSFASMSTKLLGVAGGTIALILSGAIGFSAWETKSRVESAVYAEARTEAENISNILSSKLAEAGSAGKAMSSAIAASHEAGMHDRTVVIALLKANTERYNNLYGSWMAERPKAFDGQGAAAPGANKDGVFAPYWTKSIKGRVEFSTFPADYEKPWYKLASASGKGAITEPYVSVENVLMTSVAYPVISGGKEIGVAGVDLGLDTLSQMLGAMAPFGSGRVMLLSSTGQWLAHPDPALRMKPYEGAGASDLAAALADGKPRLLRGIADGAFDRIIYPFAVPELNATWATIVDVPAEVLTAPVRREVGLMLGGGLVILLAVLGALYLTAFVVIRRPMVRLLGSIQKLEIGDYQSTVEGQEQRDETGVLAIALEGLRHALANGRHHQSVAADERRNADLTRSKADVERLASVAEQTRVVKAIGDGLSRLAEGDLVVRLQDPFAAEYEPLRTDFNVAIAKLQEAMTTVSANTAAIRSGSSEISAASDDLSRRTERQAASLEETAAALDEITATVRKTAEGSKHARAVVRSARGSAEQSGLVVQQAVEAMSSIEKSAQEISQIIGVIDEIAFQTNLLALNAGVEAARAGEAGRGFAVVASEVRALAQRSAGAAKEIKLLISTSSQQVEQGVNFVGRTGAVLSSIVAQVAEIDGIVGEIAASAQEQATALDEVNTAVNHIDQATQQNAAMVEQATAASQALTNETNELARLIGKFQVGEGGVEQDRRSSVPFAKVVRPSAGQTRVLRAIGRGGAVRKPEIESEEWNEF